MALAVTPFAALAAQQGAARAPSGRPVVVCAGQRVDDVTIYADAPTVRNLDRFPRLAQVTRALHRTTRPEVIRRFLLLGRGDSCSELRRAESERILRAQPFIAEAGCSSSPMGRAEWTWRCRRATRRPSCS